MIPSKIHEFQKDLQNGMTIEKALTKHELTLKQVWRELHYRPRNPNRPVDTSTGYRYIDYHQGKFRVYYKNEYYGHYDDLETAVQIRDYLLENGWDKRRLQNIRRTLKI